MSCRNHLLAQVRQSQQSRLSHLQQWMPTSTCLLPMYVVCCGLGCRCKQDRICCCISVLLGPIMWNVLTCPCPCHACDPCYAVLRLQLASETDRLRRENLKLRDELLAMQKAVTLPTATASPSTAPVVPATRPSPLTDQLLERLRRDNAELIHRQPPPPNAHAMLQRVQRSAAAARVTASNHDAQGPPRDVHGPVVVGASVDSAGGSSKEDDMTAGRDDDSHAPVDWDNDDDDDGDGDDDDDDGHQPVTRRAAKRSKRTRAKSKRGRRSRQRRKSLGRSRSARSTRSSRASRQQQRTKPKQPRASSKPFGSEPSMSSSQVVSEQGSRSSATMRAQSAQPHRHASTHRERVTSSPPLPPAHHLTLTHHHHHHHQRGSRATQSRRGARRPRVSGASAGSGGGGGGGGGGGRRSPLFQLSGPSLRSPLREVRSRAGRRALAARAPSTHASAPSLRQVHSFSGAGGGAHAEREGEEWGATRHGMAQPSPVAMPPPLSQQRASQSPQFGFSPPRSHSPSAPHAAHTSVSPPHPSVSRGDEVGVGGAGAGAGAGGAGGGNRAAGAGVDAARALASQHPSPPEQGYPGQQPERLPRASPPNGEMYRGGDYDAGAQEEDGQYYDGYGEDDQDVLVDDSQGYSDDQRGDDDDRWTEPPLESFMDDVSLSVRSLHAWPIIHHLPVVRRRV